MATRRRRRSRKAKRGSYVSTKSGVEYKYRSNWERVYMVYLDSSSDVIAWEYEQIKIPYVSNVRTKKVRNYKPDFYVVKADSKEVVEVKPKRKTTQATVVKKRLAAEEWCEKNDMKFRFVTEVELKVLGLL